MGSGSSSRSNSPSQSATSSAARNDDVIKLAKQLELPQADTAMVDTVLCDQISSLWHVKQPLTDSGMQGNPATKGKYMVLDDDGDVFDSRQ